MNSKVLYHIKNNLEGVEGDALRKAVRQVNGFIYLRDSEDE